MGKSQSSGDGSLGWCFPSIMGTFPLKHPDEASNSSSFLAGLLLEVFLLLFFVPPLFVTLSAMASSIFELESNLGPARVSLRQLHVARFVPSSQKSCAALVFSKLNSAFGSFQGCHSVKVGRKQIHLAPFDLFSRALVIMIS